MFGRFLIIAGFFLVNGATSAMQAPPMPQTQTSEELYQSLSTVQVDPSRIYAVRDLTLRRDGVALTLGDGKFAFLMAVDGRVTGAVFLGRGHFFALPPNAAERASVFRFLKVPLIDLDISQAYLRFDDSFRKEIERELADQKATASNDPEFVRTWAPIVAKLNPGLTLRAMEDWLSASPKPYFYAALSSETMDPFDAYVDEQRADTVTIGQVRDANGASYLDTWSAFAAPNLPAPLAEFTPLDYGIDTTINDDLSLSGTTEIHLRIHGNYERMLELELSRSLRVQSVTDSAGQKLPFFQNQDLSRQEIARRGNDALFVVLPAEAPPNDEYRLRVTYSGTVIEDAGNGVFFVGDRGSWYARVAGQQLFVPYDLKFRWPKHLTLVATGQQIETADEGSARTGHWHTSSPVAVVGFNLGDYASLTVPGNPAINLFANHDLEQAIVNRLQQNSTDRLLPGQIQQSIDATGTQGLLPNPAGVLKDLGKSLAGSVDYYEKLDGPFPFPELDVSQIPGSFGQGWPGLLYLTTLVFLPPQAQQQAGLAVEAQEEVQRLVPYHEVAHQWWGNVVDAASYRDVWLEEAVADYLSLMYDESRHPGKHSMDRWLSIYRDALLAKVPSGEETIEQAGPLDFGYRVDSSRSPDAYNTIIYDKGAWVIHMLRMMLRDPHARNPDARFAELLRNVLEKYRFQPLSTEQFEEEVNHVMTRSMDLENDHSVDWFFDEWVRSTGIPEYSATFHVRPRGDQFEIEGTLQQDGVPGAFTESVPIYETLANPRTKETIYLGNVVTTGSSTDFRFESRVRPQKLAIDPEHTILCRTK
ncbi:MAG TPA: M1 family aminopeptidase [Candidatus Acidoferrales bacterium]|nr:M1 family aminopeptidase [Candidatus Acidoferrales bacterium]